MKELVLPVSPQEPSREMSSEYREGMSVNERTSPTTISESELLDLLRHGHREEVLARISSNPEEINVSDDGSTPLLVACTRGWSDVVHKLILHGANVNVTSELGETPLMRAIKSGKVSPLVIKAMLDAGADRTINEAAKSNAFFAEWTALHFACNEEINPFPVIAALLVTYGADVGRKNAEGQTPMDMSGENFDVLKALQKPKEYMRNHALTNAEESVDEEQKTHEPVHLGTGNVSDLPKRSSLLRMGRQLLGFSKKTSTVM